jgi:hypothetical protein
MGVDSWDDEYDFDDYYVDSQYDFDFHTAETERLIEEQRLDDWLEEIEAYELRAESRFVDFDEHYEAFLSSVTPGERHKAKDRLIPLGKWWHAWKRGLWQKKETLRTHRNPKALREGKRKFYEQKRAARGYPMCVLAPLEGIRMYAREHTNSDFR